MDVLELALKHANNYCEAETLALANCMHWQLETQKVQLLSKMPRAFSTTKLSKVPSASSNCSSATRCKISRS